MVQAFRRAECPEASSRWKLRGLQRDARYELTNLNAPGASMVTGEELMEMGLPLSVQDRPGVVVVTYRQRS
jgi:hypothetical protein